MKQQELVKCDIWFEDGQIRAALKGSLDVTGLSRDLQKKGYFLANDPEDTDSQGWGKNFDEEGYYPNWVFRDGDSWVFASTPKDTHMKKEPSEIGEQDKEEMRWWILYLHNWCSS
jgi:hypothetical protein